MMAFDTFDEGISLGGMRSKTEIRTLICYLYKSVGQPMTKDAVVNALMEKGLANYFETSSSFDDLVRNGNIRQTDEEKQLYYHACDMAKKQPWADPETGKSPNFWLRSMGWYLMALIDCIDKMDEQLYEHYRALIDLFREAVSGITPYADPATGLYYQVIDRADVAGNYLETSGSAMVIYALLKGVRLGVLDGEKYQASALKAFESLTAQKLFRDEKGLYHLNGICAVAGLGPGEKRDGSVAYYLSEPVVADDAKGVGPYMMALSEYLRAK